MLRRLWAIALVALFLVPLPTHAATFGDGSYSTQQTGTALWTPASGKRLAITSLNVVCAGTTPGDVMVWFGALADTTFTQGTDQPVAYFDCATPSATVRPVFFAVFDTPVGSIAADFILRVTTSAGVTVRVIAQGYEQ